jgi:hypothetical protein
MPLSLHWIAGAQDLTQVVAAERAAIVKELEHLKASTLDEHAQAMFDDAILFVKSREPL